MRDPKLFLAAISSSLLLSSTLIQAVAGTGADAGVNGEGAGGSRYFRPVPEWEVLTKRNFSSQMRLHPRVLLMVTVPWCGESRSLMKALAHLVAVKKDELGYLKLMVVYRNTEKMLAEVIGASDEITLFYYHQSTSFKYNGRLRVQNILSSVYHFMSIKPEEVPLKKLQTIGDIEVFFQSTDKAVILLEFCGWSAELMHKMDNRNYDTALSVLNHTENVGNTITENLAADGDNTLAFHKEQQKGLENDELTCTVEKELASLPWVVGFTLANQSISQGTGKRSVGISVSCTKEEHLRFESFFMKFTRIAREHFLPPERQRFGLVTDRSLLPSLGVGNTETWLLTLHFPGCPICSMILQEEDDLRSILQTQQSLVMELNVDGHNLEPAFPANRPSIVLFVDRSSDSSKVRGESIMSVEVLRKFAWQNQLASQLFRGVDNGNSESSSAQAFCGMSSRSKPNPLVHQTRKDSWNTKVVKIKDNMAITMVNEGETISLKNTAPEIQSSPVYDILRQLLHQKKSALKGKETKMSFLAKEVGFQLLSNDFEVQVEDSLPSNEENNLSDDFDAQVEDSLPSHKESNHLNVIEDVALSPEIQTSELLKGSTEDDVNMDNIGILDTIDVTAVGETQQPESTVVESDPQIITEAVPYDESKNNIFATTGADKVEVDKGVWESKEVNEENGSCKQEESESFTCLHENSSSLEHEPEIVDKNSREEHAGQADCSSNKTYSCQVAQDLTDAPSLDFVGDDTADVEKPTTGNKSSYVHDHPQPFLGSFFFSDGGYQMLRALTGGSKIPSLVILDPVLQQHYVFPDETEISYSSLVNFVIKFLNGSLPPYCRSASSMISSRETPRPPFVNLDFHEADSVPLVTSNTFCEIVLGFKPCEMGNTVPLPKRENLTLSWKMDILVLFSTSSCGFCQRMELIVREVFRAFKSFMSMSKRQLQNMDPMQIKDKEEDLALNGVPSLFLMDCTLNDCNSFLKPMGKREVYPTLLLFPAENKTAISYEGDMSVINIIEFLESHGRNSQYLSKHKGSLWTRAQKKNKHGVTLHDVSSLSVQEQAPVKDEYNNFFIPTAVRDADLHVRMDTSKKVRDVGKHVVVGSTLAATDKLLNASPFDNSMVLIVMADENQGFQGMVINKRISWDVFKGLDKDLEPLKHAPLSYGGPVRTHGLPLVSLARKAIAGYTKVTAGIYFGNPVTTSLALEGIKSGDQSPNDYWFFLGYSSWAYEQLFDELADGAWELSESPVEHLAWPDS